MEHPPLDDLSAALDEALSGPRAAQLSAHLAGCAECRERQALLALARAYSHALPPVTGSAAIDYFRAGSAPRRSMSRRVLTLILIGLGLLLLAALGLWRLAQPSAPPSAPSAPVADGTTPGMPTPGPGAATGRASATQAGYPRPLGTALASDLARLAALAALAQTAAAAPVPSGTATLLPPAPTQTAFAAALAATEQAGRQLQGGGAAAASLTPPTVPVAGSPSAAALATPEPLSPRPTAPAAPEWLPLVAVAVLCLGLGLLLLARRR
jgi:hypothetical protein